MFDNYWKNINGQKPIRINEIDGLNFFQEGLVGNALKVDRKNSYLEYSCEKNFNPGYGSMTVWVSFDKFNKDAVIWQTNDSRYALYYEVGNRWQDFDKRIVVRAGGNDAKNYPEAEFILDPAGGALNKWGANEWHFITMTWEGKFDGKVKLYIDGRKVDEADYNDATGCSTFRIGNSYRKNDRMNFSIGKIDEFKLHQWAMPQQYIWQNYMAYSSNSKFGKKGIPEGRVAGANIRALKKGSLVKAPNGNVYIITNGKKMHVADLNALSRLRPERLQNVSWDEINQYEETPEKFYSWSRFPNGSLLKAVGSNTVYYLPASGKLIPILNESVFYKYNNEWKDVITISQAEINTYEIGQVGR